MACGHDMGTKTLNEYEVYEHQRIHMEGPGTEPTIIPHHREKDIVAPPPMPETRAASKEYKDLYEDVFSQIGR